MAKSPRVNDSAFWMFKMDVTSWPIWTILAHRLLARCAERARYAGQRSQALPGLDLGLLMSCMAWKPQLSLMFSHAQENLQCNALRLEPW